MQSPTLATDAADPLGVDRPDDRRNGRELADAVAANLTRLRRNSGLAIDDLAAQSGLPHEYLVALEAGRIIPTLRSLWVLAELFEVPFGVLISGAPCATTNFHVLRAGGSRIVDSADGGFRSRALSAAGDPREPEVYEVTLAPGWTEEAEAHAPDTFEHIVVVRGLLVVHAGNHTATLARGDVVFFRADVPHTYQNPDTSQTVLHLTMTYAGDWVEEGSND